MVKKIHRNITWYVFSAPCNFYVECTLYQ